MEGNECFKFAGVGFDIQDNGKIKCGVCQIEWPRLIVHLNKNVECKSKFNMEEFRKEYSNFRSRQRRTKYDSKRKLEDPKAFRDNVNQRKVLCGHKSYGLDLYVFVFYYGQGHLKVPG